MKTAAKPKTWEEILVKRSSGYLVVRSEGEPPFKWRSRLKLALKDVDRAREAWGVRMEIWDCATKQRLFEFRSLGA